MLEHGTFTRKTIQCIIAAVILWFFWTTVSFEVAVIAGLALNSADLNEAREKLVRE